MDVFRSIDESSAASHHVPLQVLQQSTVSPPIERWLKAMAQVGQFSVIASKLLGGITSVLSERPLKYADQKTERGKY